MIGRERRGGGGGKTIYTDLIFSNLDSTLFRISRDQAKMLTSIVYGKVPKSISIILLIKQIRKSRHQIN